MSRASYSENSGTAQTIDPELSKQLDLILRHVWGVDCCSQKDEKSTSDFKPVGIAVFKAVERKFSLIPPTVASILKPSTRGSYLELS
jgi:hypothetical protein